MSSTRACRRFNAVSALHPKIAAAPSFESGCRPNTVSLVNAGSSRTMLGLNEGPGAVPGCMQRKGTRCDHAIMPVVASTARTSRNKTSVQVQEPLCFVLIGHETNKRRRFGGWARTTELSQTWNASRDRRWQRVQRELAHVQHTRDCCLRQQPLQPKQRTLRDGVDRLMIDSCVRDREAAQRTGCVRAPLQSAGPCNTAPSKELNIQADTAANIPSAPAAAQRSAPPCLCCSQPLRVPESDVLVGASVGMDVGVVHGKAHNR
jgi:hypothetical protein